jgi:hypothetical protein
MNNVEQASAAFAEQLASDDAEVRGEFIKRYATQARAFSEAMGTAFMNWRSLDDMVNGDERRAFVSGLVFTAITLQVASMKLFLSGQPVGSGNLMRQVVETMALALLCSAGKHLPVLEAFMHGKYSTNDAVRDMLRNAKALGLNDFSAVRTGTRSAASIAFQSEMAHTQPK